MGGNLDPGERLKFAEERRKASEAVLWQLPSVSIAAQAFLLSAGLNPDARPWARVLVGFLGVVAVMATGFVVAFQGVRVTALSRWVDSELAGDPILQDRGLNPAQKWWLHRFPGPLWPWTAVLVGFVLADLFVIFKGFNWL